MFLSQSEAAKNKANEMREKTTQKHYGKEIQLFFVENKKRFSFKG